MTALCVFCLHRFDEVRVVLFGDVVREDCGYVLTAVLRLLAHTLVQRLSPRVEDIVAGADRAHAASYGRARGG